MKILNRRQAHWTEFLAIFNFVIIHQKSKENPADAFLYRPDYTLKRKNVDNPLKDLILKRTRQDISSYTDHIGKERNDQLDIVAFTDDQFDIVASTSDLLDLEAFTNDLFDIIALATSTSDLLDLAILIRRIVKAVKKEKSQGNTLFQSTTEDMIQ